MLDHLYFYFVYGQQFIFDVAERHKDTPTHKKRLAETLRDIWEQLNDKTRENIKQYSDLAALLSSFAFDDPYKSQSIPHTFSVVLEVLKTDRAIKTILDEHFTNTVTVMLFSPAYSAKKGMQFPVHIEDVHLQCHELLDLFFGLSPAKVEEVKKAMKEDDPKKAKYGDPTEYTLAGIVRIALLARLDDLRSQMEQRVHRGEFDQLLQGRSFSIQTSLTTWSEYNLATLGWWTLKGKRKITRSVGSNTPFRLEFKWMQYWEEEAQYESFINEYLCYAIQEILHVGAGNHAGHFRERRASTDPTKITYTDGELVKLDTLYTQRELTQRSQICSISIVSVDVPVRVEKYHRLKVSTFLTRPVSTLIHSEELRARGPRHFIEYRSKPIPFPDRSQVLVCCVIISTQL